MTVSDTHLSDPRSNATRSDWLWGKILTEAQELARDDPLLARRVDRRLLSHSSLTDAVCHAVSAIVASEDLTYLDLLDALKSIAQTDQNLQVAFGADLIATYERDPACHRFLEPLLYFKGYLGLCTHRFAHCLWNEGRSDLAYTLQSHLSKVAGIDIHPAVVMGRGIMVDHGTGLVVGETAVIADNVSILQNVTLGGTGKACGDRHPKIGCNVLIGAGAKILGNIIVGNCAKVASGSVVLRDVEPRTTVAGIPAKFIGTTNCPEPSKTMDHFFSLSDEETARG